MDDKQIKQNLKVQTKFWNAQGGYEKGQAQQFWNSILRCFDDKINLSETIVYEKQVKEPGTGATKFIDGYITKTRVIIEQKSSHIDLNKPEPQSDGSKLTPFQQAERYDNWLPLSEKARYIVCSNFRTIEIHDRNRPLEPPTIIPFTDDGIEKNYYRLKFLLDEQSSVTALEVAVSKAAAQHIGSLYDDIIKLYSKEELTPDFLHSLNVFCVRLVFCFYAEDALVFRRKDMFGNYMKKYTQSRDEFRKNLKLLFDVLNTPNQDRDPDDLALNEFPYVNGGLFALKTPLPRITENIAIKITQKISLGFDWSPINPAIFGAMFESTLSPQARREGGMHYTSTDNIDKAVGTLFLNDLRQKLTDIIATGDINQKTENLINFQKEIASIKVFDPACGSGNFLTYSYMELRRLENKVLYELKTMGVWDAAVETRHGTSLQPKMPTPPQSPVMVSLSQFYGLEINDFAVDTAKTALWIAQNQMLHETQEILGTSLPELPLSNIDTIHCVNALRVDWEDYAPTQEIDYIVGNPPFVGARIMSKTQKEEVIDIFGKDWKNVGNMDYVTCWYKKAYDFMKQNPKIRCAFVSTNSICQGEQVANLWKPLMEGGLRISFAYRTFKWESDSVGMAHVHCVIVGFDLTPQPPLLGGEGVAARSNQEQASSQQSLPSPPRRGAGGEVSEVGIIRSQRITPEKLELARTFRKNPTESEDAVWQMLRNRKIHNLKWRRQQIIDGFIADFYCAELNAVLEIDGSVHDSEEAINYDEARTEIFARRGVKTYRIKNEDCNEDNVRRVVEEMLNDLTPKPPLLGGEGVATQSNQEQASSLQVCANQKPQSCATNLAPQSLPSPLRRGAGGEVKIVSPDGTIEYAKNINAYLFAGDNIFIESRNKPICEVPEICVGNQPIDGGNYLFTEEQMIDFLNLEPKAKPYFHPYYGAEEFINNKKRFCLWLGDANPMELAKMPLVLERVKAVQAFRLASKRTSTLRAAKTPTRFGLENIPTSNYLLIPRVSSEKRKYIPIGFMDKNDFVSDSVHIIPSATLYHFGILTSIVHNAWMRVVAGRLKSDYRYSKDIVYNNFPWPGGRDVPWRVSTVETLSQKILDIREKYAAQGASLADLYGENLDLLFTDLANAHKELDEAVLRLYGLPSNATEAEMVARCFEMIGN